MLKELRDWRPARWWMALVVAGGISYQLLIFLALVRDVRFGNPILDSRFQIDWAFDLARGVGHDRLFFQSPLYAYANAALLKIVGWQPVLVALLQLGMVLTSAGCVFVAVRSLGVRPALRTAAVALTLFWPLFPYYAADLNKTALEIFFTALTLAGGSLLLAAPPEDETNARSATDSAAENGGALRGTIPWALLGLVIGLSTLVRPSFLLVPLVFAPFLLLRKKSGRVLFAALLLGCLPPVAWAVSHNSLVAGQLLPVQTSGGYNLFLGNNRHNPSGTQQAVPGTTLVPLLEESTAKETAERDEGRKLTPREVNAYYVGRVTEFIGRDPDWFTRILGEKIRRYGHRTELPDNECFPCTAADLASLRLNPLRFDFLVWLALPAALALFFLPLGGNGRTNEKERGPTSFLSAQLFPLAFGLFLAVTVIAFFLNSRVRVAHVTVWIVVLAQGAESLLRAHRSGRFTVRRVALLAAAALPGLWWIFQGPLDESYHPDNFTAKRAVVEAELGYGDAARRTVTRVEDPEVREQLSNYLLRLEAGQEPPLLSPQIPKRKQAP